MRLAQLRLAAVAVLAAAAVSLSGCLNMDLVLPPVTITIPIATDQPFQIIAAKQGDKVTLDFPEICTLPTEAQVEQSVEDVLGPVAGLLEIESVTINRIDYTATTGDFDFIDTFGFGFTSGETTAGLSADLTGQTGVTEFTLLPDNGNIDLLDLLPDNVGDCVGVSVTYDGAIVFDPVVYSATMEVTIQGVAHL